MNTYYFVEIEQSKGKKGLIQLNCQCQAKERRDKDADEGSSARVGGETDEVMVQDKNPEADMAKTKGKKCPKDAKVICHSRITCHSNHSSITEWY